METFVTLGHLKSDIVISTGKYDYISKRFVNISINLANLINTVSLPRGWIQEIERM